MVCGSGQGDRFYHLEVLCILKNEGSLSYIGFVNLHNNIIIKINFNKIRLMGEFCSFYMLLANREYFVILLMRNEER